MHRFFIPPEWINQNLVTISGGLVHQLYHVLRLKNGDRIIILDNSGWEYEVELTEMAKSCILGVIRNKNLNSAEPGIRITLYQALLKGSKFEFVLQKGTELGVVSFIPVICERCVVRNGRTQHRLVRWREIIQEAAEQSGRGRLPFLASPISFREACRLPEGISMLAWEKEEAVTLRSVLESRCKVNKGNQVEGVPFNLFIGPEGGFTAEEAEFAQSCGIMPVGLGKRILRAETAGLAAIAAILYHCGDFGGKIINAG